MQDVRAAAGWDQVDLHRAMRRRAVRGRNPVLLPRMVEMATVVVLLAWFRLLPTNWKKLSCAASAANWNRARMAGGGDRRGVIQGQEKVGRNDPCPCGSGKKYKKCHGS